MISEVYNIDCMEGMSKYPDNLEFDFIGYELDEDYYNDQEKRFNDYKNLYNLKKVNEFFKF